MHHGQHKYPIFPDLVDDPVVTAPCRVEAFEFANQRLPEPLGVLSDGPEDGREGSIADFLGELVEVAQTLRGDLDFVHEVASDVI